MGIAWIYNHSSNSTVESSFNVWGHCITTMTKLDVSRKKTKTETMFIYGILMPYQILLHAILIQITLKPQDFKTKR